MTAAAIGNGQVTNAEAIDGIREAVTKSIANILAEDRDVKAQLTKQLNKLEAQEERLIELAATGSLPIAKSRERIEKATLQKEAIKEKIGYYPWIECNRDSDGNSQLYQVYICVDTNGKDLIECPVLPRGNCASRVQFPKF